MLRAALSVQASANLAQNPVFCPNCMSPYVEPVPPDPEMEGEGPPDEPLLRCTECEYSAPRSEFVPENYR